jgi:glycosyltransferase involved in cell wall biosynthesis
VRLLVFNLATDADDPVLGFTTSWLRALAARAAVVEVITMRQGRMHLPANVRVRSVGKERGYGIPRRVAEFYRLLAPLLRDRAVDGCFSHMMPAFSVLGGPLLRARGIPLVTWYAHPSLTLELRLAHHLSDRMVTSLPTAYPYRADKLEAIGQGIDTGAFAPGPAPADGPPLILCVGRLSPVKDHSTLLEAAAVLRAAEVSFRLALVGGPATARDEAYVSDLRSRVHAHGLDDVVTLAGPQPPSALPDWYGRCTAHVNLTPAGFGDKVALEAMSCARPSLTCNEGFRDVLGRHADALMFPRGDAGGLAAKLRGILDTSAAAREEMGRDLRRQVVEGHGLDRLAGRVCTLVAELALRRGRAAT